MKRAFEPVAPPPTTQHAALMAAPQLYWIPPEVLQFAVEYAQSPVEAAFEAWTEKFKQGLPRGPLPAAPALALLPDGSVQLEVQAYFKELTRGSVDSATLHHHTMYSPHFYDRLYDGHGRTLYGYLADQLFKLESREDWVHMLLLAVYGVPRGVFLGNYGPLAGWLCGVRGEWEKPNAWLNTEYQRLRRY